MGKELLGPMGKGGDLGVGVVENFRAMVKGRRSFQKGVPGTGYSQGNLARSLEEGLPSEYLKSFEVAIVSSSCLVYEVYHEANWSDWSRKCVSLNLIAEYLYQFGSHSYLM